jgi:hypothetical protein
MKAILVAVLVACVGCGEVISDPAIGETSAASAQIPLCGEMGCLAVACFASPDGGRPLCYCGLSEDPAYQSDKPIACACWERLPDDFAGQTGCSYTSPE